MSKRQINFTVGSITLILGLLIYILFRENTYVAKPFQHIGSIQQLWEFLDRYPFIFLRYYFPDYLWGVSLSAFLCAVNKQDNLHYLTNASIAFCYGVVWELLQSLGALNGTGDYLDVLMYLLAGLTTVFLNVRRKTK